MASDENFDFEELEKEINLILNNYEQEEEVIIRKNILRKLIKYKSQKFKFYFFFFLISKFLKIYSIKYIILLI
jgi:hypothetical protein